MKDLNLLKLRSYYANTCYKAKQTFKISFPDYKVYSPPTQFNQLRKWPLEN